MFCGCGEIDIRFIGNFLYRLILKNLKPRTESEYNSRLYGITRLHEQIKRRLGGMIRFQFLKHPDKLSFALIREQTINYGKILAKVLIS